MNVQPILSQSGLLMFFKDWELKILVYLWDIQPSGASSKEVWDHLRNNLGESISWASIITFMKEMTEQGVLIKKTSNKRGYNGIYYQKYTQSEFKQYLAEHIIRKILKEFPDEARKVINAFNTISF